MNTRTAWSHGYTHRKCVCQGEGEYGRDEDGDGYYEVRVIAIKEFWPLLRSWLRPRHGISQAHLLID